MVFAALGFAFKFDSFSLLQALWAFIAFGFFASSVYIINDIFDYRADRKHPEKKHRPIACGAIKIWQAYLFFCLILTLGFIFAQLANFQVLEVCITYLVINLLYSFGLKHTPIVDVMIVASGFVLRVVAGAYAIAVPISHWILLCTFFISLFMAFGKRRNEMIVLGQDRRHRKSISEYTEGFISQMLSLSAGISVVFYALYTIDPTTIERFGTDHLIYTTPIVVFAVLRYFHLLYNKDGGGDPVKVILGDYQLILSVLFWLGSIVGIYYIK